MKVIFRVGVPSVAHAGDIKDVAEGYARNYLLPKGLAVAASPSHLKEVATRQQQQKKAQVIEERTSDKLSSVLRGKSFSYRARASEQGTLFAGVTAEKVAAILKTNGFEVPASAVQLREALKSTGEHSITLKFGDREPIQILLTIMAERS